MNASSFSLMLQMCDGNFPNGAFSHSFGLETLIEEGLIHDASTFVDALDDWFHLQLVPFDGLAAHIAWERASASDIDGILDVAELVTASLLAEQSRRGAMQVGKRSLQVLKDLVPNGMTQVLWEKVATDQAHVTHAIALAVAAADSQVEQDFATAAVLYSGLANVVATAIRAIPIGQTKGQQILAIGRGWIRHAPSLSGHQLTDISSAAAWWEIAQMNHKYLSGRLFMS